MTERNYHVPLIEGEPPKQINYKDLGAESADLVQIGNTLRTERLERGIKKGYISKTVGISNSYIYKIEHSVFRTKDQLSRPSFPILHKWTTALNLPEDRSEQVLRMGGYELLANPQIAIDMYINKIKATILSSDLSMEQQTALANKVNSFASFLKANPDLI